MKKKQVKKFLGILMASAMIFTTTVSPMAADMEAFGDEIQITQESEGEFGEDASEDQVTIEDSASDEDESLDIVSDDSEEESEETAVFSDSDVFSDDTENTDETKRTEEEALSALYAAFSNYKINSPLAFPYGTGEGKYTNALTFLQDKIQEIVPKSEYEVSFNYTSAMAGTSGKETTMDTTTLDIAPVHAAGITKPGFIGVTFSIGDKVSAKITQLYLAVDPIEMTPLEAVEFEAGLVNFDTIKGTNTSQDQIVSKIGKTSGSTVGTLPTAAEIYKSGVNTVVASWAVEYVSGSANCLTLDAKGTTTTVVRPNVGKEDGHYLLKATYANKTDPTINKTVTYELTVPAFEGVVLPVRVTPSGATLTVTDKYYNTQVSEEYISSAEDGLYNYTLHAGAAGGSQSFSWTVQKEGYITKTGDFTIGAGAQAEQEIVLSESSEDDAKLQSLAVATPAAGSPSIKTPMGEFDKDTAEYEITVGALDSITISASAIVPEATVKVKRYSSLANANKGTYVAPAVLKSTGTMTCYLKTDGETVIEITVTAPDSSTQEVKTNTYKLTVKKSGEAAHSLKDLTITAKGSDNSISKNTLSGTGYTEEEKLSPAVDAGGIADEYRYEVNYYRDQISIKPALTTTSDKVKIEYSQDGETKTIDAANNKASDAIPVEVGDNAVKVVVTRNSGTANETSETYNVCVRRKQKPEGNLQLEGTEDFYPFEVTKDWTGRMNFNHSLRELSLKANVPENVTVKIAGEDKEYKNGDKLTISVDDKASKMVTFIWNRTIADEKDETKTIQETQRYVVNFIRAAAESADFLGFYLPAPGQFVNDNTYKDASATLAGPNSGKMVTLGSFGGSIVYEFEEPIQNSDQNPYGVDFIVFGNVQKSAGGESYASGMEPAAVMVSQDGTNWYELAGSDYYERTTQHNITMTYTNPDTTFKTATDIPWTDTTGASGVVKANSYHSQPYYPDPLTYASMNTGVGANDSYTEASMSVNGTRVSNSAALRFGYGDTHANASGNLTTAANPYKENPYYDSNGDGMDISWAVDADGNPVQLASVKYVKIYTAQSKDNGSMGEVSSEVSGVLRAKQSEESVGTSSELQSILIDGEEVTLQKGVYTYNDVPVNDISAFKVTPTAAEDSNIYVSNQWVKSGTTSKTVSVQKTLRVIVQDGQKAPVIYYFNLSGKADPADNTTLKNVSVMPGDAEAVETENGYEASVLDSCMKVRIAAEPMDEDATVKINGKTVSYDNDYFSDVISLNEGDTEIQVEVTSRSGKVTKTYPVIIKKISVDEKDSVQIKFSLVGDEKHGNAAHTWRSLWLDRISCKVPKGSTAKLVTEMMFLNNDIPFTVSNGNYIVEINGLKERDNGPASGWMYAVNGTTDNVDSFDTQILNEDSAITWFYVDDYTVDKVPDLDNINADHVCHCDTWKTISRATVFQPEKQQGTCSVCGKTLTRFVGSKLTATIKLNAKSIKLQKKQTTKKIKVTMANGDSVKSWKSSNKKIVTVNKNGVIKAGKKNGTAKITVTLKSGKKATLKVKVQSSKVKTTKISGLKSRETLKKGKKLTLKPVISPLTSQEKVTYTSSNKKVAIVSKKGVITAKKKGTAKITVKSGKKSYTVKVTVK